MVNQDEEGVVYTDHSGDEQCWNPQHERQPEELDLNTTANDAVGIGNTNMGSGGVQNGQPPPHNPNSGSRPSAFDRLGQASMELEVRELRKENTELRTTTRNLQSRGRTPPRRRSQSQSRSLPRRNHQPVPSRGGDVIIAVRMTVSPPQKEIVMGIGGPIGNTRRLKAGK
ncbi:hypothetical protein PIB30_060025 [Stylosanthes scabra]|uniref:Uncharacterized protein n=1 Tax=Stylosanthes scabra TaxID=79078 RepID=A0ABU6ZJ45_9FABA|nr:hypothetical protein [Stylosanthes scabra]